jgi:hypothetical protein
VKYPIILALVLCAPGLSQVCAPNGTVRPNAQLQDTLSASSCLLADGTPYADYLAVFPSRGVWTASVTAGDGVTPFSLILRDQSGAKIASGASISQNVERGTYHVIVNVAAPGQSGGFTLNSAFSAAPNVLCQQFALLGSGMPAAGASGTPRQVSGTLGAGSCTLPDGSVYDGYQATVYGTGTLDVAITSQFTPLLILRTSDGASLGETLTPDANGVLHLTIPEIGNDTFTLIVAVSSPDQAGGAYSLSATFTPDASETCVSLASLTATQQLTGSIATGSCNFNLPGRDDDSPFNFYNIHLASTGTVQAAVGTADFSSLLLLLDADGNPVSEDISSGPTGTPLIRQQLAPGDYRLVIFNEANFGGNYTLNYQVTAGAAPACPVPVISSGGQVSGTITGGSSCQDGPLLADAYQIVLPSDGTVALSFASPVFSTFLDLHDAKDNDLTWGTSSADGSTSSLTVDLPAGTYYADAASMDLPGGYSLSYTFTPKTLAVCPAPMAIAPNEAVFDAQMGAPLGTGNCKGPDGRWADYYQFTLSQPATEAIFQLSEDILPDLTLYDQNGVPLRRDQNSYAKGNAVIVQYLQAGSYQVRARSADPTLSGAYNLYLYQAQGGPPPFCSSSPLPLNGTVSGQTSFTSCTWYDKTFADVYRVDVTGSTQVFDVSCLSTAFDTYLILLSQKGDVLASDDNSAGGTNAGLVQTLNPGTYFLVVKPATDPASSGAYSLVTVTGPAPAPSGK